jgi:hypothetical protein
MTIPDVTFESITQARAAQRAERERVFQETGVLILESGKPVLKLVPKVRPMVIVCPKGCGFETKPTTEGHAIRAISAHIVAKHDPRGAA